MVLFQKDSKEFFKNGKDFLNISIQSMCTMKNYAKKSASNMKKPLPCHTLLRKRFRYAPVCHAQEKMSHILICNKKLWYAFVKFHHFFLTK